MDSRKVCKDARGAPCSCRKTGSARQSAIGGGRSSSTQYVQPVRSRVFVTRSGYESTDDSIPRGVPRSQRASQADQAGFSLLSHLNAQTPGKRAEYIDGMVVFNRAGLSHARCASTMEAGQAASRACTLLRLHPAAAKPAGESASSSSVS